ncbi:MAG: glycosyltransferase family 4 protein, partial [Planctomycetota bacterium]
MLNYEYPPIGGGAGKAHQNLIAEFANMNNLQVDVLTSAENPTTRIETVGDNITIHRLGIHKKNLHYWKKREVIEWLLKAGRVYKKLIRENDYDLVHSFFAFPSGYLCLKTAGQIPYIVSLRGSDVPGFNVRLKLDYHLLKGLFHRIWRRADAVIANSSGLAQLAKKFEPDMDIGVICNGVNTDRFAPPSERSLGGRIKLVTVCRLISRKRIHLLIEALATIVTQGIDAELNIVGEGNLQTELAAVATRLNIADRVHFRGLVDYEQMPSEYQQNHLFVMSSAHEGMSNAMLEALACGLPVVTTACEGASELINDNGIAVDEPDSNKIADAISDIISQPARYQQMSVASRNKAIAFSWALPAKKYVDIYR